MGLPKGTIKNESKLGQVKKCLHAVKIKTREQVNESNKVPLKTQAKHSEVGQAIVQTYPDLNWKDFDHQKFVEIRAAFIEFLNSKTTKELYTRMEMNNLLKVLKLDTLIRIQEALKEKRPLSKRDTDRMDKLFEHLATLDKIKHGEKKINIKADFSFIQDLTKTDNTQMNYIEQEE